MRTPYYARVLPIEVPAPTVDDLVASAAHAERHGYIREAYMTLNDALRLEARS